MIVNRESRVVYSAVLARNLIKQGFIVVDIKPNDRDHKRTVFVFGGSKELDLAIERYINR